MKSYFESKLDAVKKGPRIVRITVGMLLIAGGVLGFFPVLGFWMIPLGLVLLAADFRWARHALVNLKLRWRRFRRHYYPKKNRRLESADTRSE